MKRSRDREQSDWMRRVHYCGGKRSMQAGQIALEVTAPRGSRSNGMFTLIMLIMSDGVNSCRFFFYLFVLFCFACVCLFSVKFEINMFCQNNQFVFWI